MGRSSITKTLNQSNMTKEDHKIRNHVLEETSITPYFIIEDKSKPLSKQKIAISDIQPKMQSTSPEHSNEITAGISIQMLGMRNNLRKIAFQV